MVAGRAAVAAAQSTRRTPAPISDGGPAAGASRFHHDRSSPPSFMCCARAASGKRCPRVLAVPAPFTRTSSAGGTTDFSCGCGRQVWRNTTRWKVSLGLGRVSTAPWAKRPSRKRPSDPIRRTGGKKGTKRSLLVDGAGVPLSLIVSGANRHDVKLLDVTLDGIVVLRPKPTTDNRSICVPTKPTRANRPSNRCGRGVISRMFQTRRRPRAGTKPKDALDVGWSSGRIPG